MSLLNDALRAAEQRQSRPAAPGAYVGQQRQPANRGSLIAMLLVILVALIAIGAGYWFFTNSPEKESVVEAGEPSPDQAVQRQSVKEESLAAVDGNVANEPVSGPAPQPVIPQQTAPAPTPEPANPEVSSAAPAPPPPVAKAAPEENTTSEEREPEPSGETSTAGVKQIRQTPVAADRSTARELEQLVARGKITDAERGLAALTQRQAAPRSRYVVARALLVDGRQDQALDWLPENITVEHPRLRLLRARAQHANGDLAAAIDTLAADVPPVQEYAEYRVTLATLLQQQGDNPEAARHWAALIAWDDSQGPWWVGLAITLEAQGERAAAARAYGQAAGLPGLPGSLADYVQRRLQALRAG